GSGARPGYVDILLEMKCLTHAATDRRRLLNGFSRHEETPRQLVIELNAAGTDYQACGEPEEVEFAQNWLRLQTVLGTASRKLTRVAIRASWPNAEVPSEVSLWRWLEAAVARGLVCRDGNGHKSSPFRYWLAGQEEKWQQDPFYLPDLEDLEPLPAGTERELLQKAKKK